MAKPIAKKTLKDEKQGKRKTRHEKKKKYLKKSKLKQMWNIYKDEIRQYVWVSFCRLNQGIQKHFELSLCLKLVFLGSQNLKFIYFNCDPLLIRLNCH